MEPRSLARCTGRQCRSACEGSALLECQVKRGLSSANPLCLLSGSMHAGAQSNPVGGAAGIIAASVEREDSHGVYRGMGGYVCTCGGARSVVKCDVRVH